MANELYRQRALLKQVKKEGGFGYKTTSPMVAGISDLTIMMPHLPVFLIEVKLVNTVNCKVKLTKLQMHNISKIHNSKAVAVPLIAVWAEDLKTFAFCNRLSKCGRIPVNPPNCVNKVVWYNKEESLRQALSSAYLYLSTPKPKDWI